MNPSRYHNNRKSYNWLIYDIGDYYLQRYTKYYRGTVYDLGCGEAVFKKFFLYYAEEYIGVDWSDSYHETSADIIADLNQTLPIESNAADTIVSISVMEHLKEPQLFLNESFRILKSGGSMMLQVPWQWHIHEAPHDYFRYTPYALREMLVRAGFKKIEIEPSSGFFTTIIIKVNYFSRKFIKGPKLLKWIIECMLTPFWYIGQKAAPYLDKLDKNWASEAQGYYIIAKK